MTDMWNPIKAAQERREARAAERDRQERQAYTDRQVQADREMDYIVAMERADTVAKWEQQRNLFDARKWEHETVEPWTWEQIEAREAEIEETLDWADWSDELKDDPYDYGQDEASR